MIISPRSIDSGGKSSTFNHFNISALFFLDKEGVMIESLAQRQFEEFRATIRGNSKWSCRINNMAAECLWGAGFVYGREVD